jgi:phosphate-selective porin
MKYDMLDPNSDVDADQIGVANSNLTVGDIKYSTLGIGWIYHWDANVKFTTYYDIVMNEKINSNATGALKPFIDDIKDNVFTLRMQYKF